jgi:hypothetical protein
MRFRLRLKLAFLVVVVVAFAGAFGVSGAAAAVPGPGYSIRAVAGPTIFSAEAEALPNTYMVTVTNTGSEPTDGSPIVISDELPRGLTATGIRGELNEEGQHKLTCEVATVRCTYDPPLQPSQRLIVMVEVKVEPGTVGPVTNSAFVSGGGAPQASANVLTAIGTAAEMTSVPFGSGAVFPGSDGCGRADRPAGGRSPV